MRAENQEEDDHRSDGQPPWNRSRTPDEGRDPKRQRVGVNEFLWVQCEILSVTLNPSLTTMLALLKLFTQDPKLAKALILTSP